MIEDGKVSTASCNSAVNSKVQWNPRDKKIIITCTDQSHHDNEHCFTTTELEPSEKDIVNESINLLSDPVNDDIASVNTTSEHNQVSMSAAQSIPTVQFQISDT